MEISRLDSAMIQAEIPELRDRSASSNGAVSTMCRNCRSRRNLHEVFQCAVTPLSSQRCESTRRLQVYEPSCRSRCCSSCHWERFAPGIASPRRLAGTRSFTSTRRPRLASGPRHFPGHLLEDWSLARPLAWLLFFSMRHVHVMTCAASVPSSMSHLRQRPDLSSVPPSVLPSSMRSGVPSGFPDHSGLP